MPSVRKISRQLLFLSATTGAPLQNWQNIRTFATRVRKGSLLHNIKLILMGGFFGTISKEKCVNDLFYGTDYNSHMGTRRGGLATYSKEDGFQRSIHNLQSAYFRSKFEDELDKFSKGTSGIGVISDTDPQPIVINSHLGKFAIVTVARVVNMNEIVDSLLAMWMASRMCSGQSRVPVQCFCSPRTE